MLRNRWPIAGLYFLNPADTIGLRSFFSFILDLCTYLSQEADSILNFHLYRTKVKLRSHNEGILVRQQAGKFQHLRCRPTPSYSQEG
jgi:hypothetical protein